MNHTNVATLYGFEKEGDTSSLVMEVVEGETLAEKENPTPSLPKPQCVLGTDTRMFCCHIQTA